MNACRKTSEQARAGSAGYADPVNLFTVVPSSLLLLPGMEKCSLNVLGNGSSFFLTDRVSE